MKRLYQWLSGRATFFHLERPERGTGRTVRTEVTVERQSMTLLVDCVPAAFDICPLCGQKLAPTTQAEQVGLVLPKDSANRDYD
jgi:hypothetical protein